MIAFTGHPKAAGPPRHRPGPGRAPRHDPTAGEWRAFVEEYLSRDRSLRECIRLTIEDSQDYAHARECFRAGAPTAVVRGLLLHALMGALL